MTIYLDHAATTPVLAPVAAAMAAVLGAPTANASATHAPGRQARAKVEAAREEVAALVGARAEQIVWTSGATEADNLAVAGILSGATSAHLVTSRIEHRAVLDVVQHLERQGVRATRVACEADGRMDPARMAAALRPETRLLSLMLVNNETGVRQDVADVVRRCAAAGVLVHTDAAQAIGHEPVNLPELGVDLASLSAHKMGGPAGVGALYLSDRAIRALQPLLHGGGQERGLRPGTLAVHQIVGFGAACREAALTGMVESRRQRALTERLADALLALPGVQRNGTAPRVAHILNLAFAEVDGEALQADLYADLAVSGGSACAAERGEPSYVLRAIGRSDALAEASVRFSVGRETTDKDIDMAVKIVEKSIFRLRRMGA